VAVEIVDRLDYDFADSSRGVRLHTVRVATFDAAVRRFLATETLAEPLPLVRAKRNRSQARRVASPDTKAGAGWAIDRVGERCA
jgi:hypothetical protein